MTACFWCLVDRSDQPEGATYCTGSDNISYWELQRKVSLLLVQLLPKTWTTWSKYLLATPTFHILFEVGSAETIPPELSLLILVNTEGSSHPISLYSMLSRAPHSALNGLSHESKSGPVGLLTNHMGQHMSSIANASNLGRQPLLMFGP